MMSQIFYYPLLVTPGYTHQPNGQSTFFGVGATMSLYAPVKLRLSLQAALFSLFAQRDHLYLESMVLNGNAHGFGSVVCAGACITT